MSKIETRFDVVVVGAGFAGLYALHRFRELGLSARVFEAGDGVGGTWYWNRYPGARCDVESMDYSYSFSPELEQDWEWTERFPSQPELLRYANHVASRFDLLKDIQLETRIVSAVFDGEAERWTVETDRGDTVSARFCVMATGCLSAWQIPAFAGRDSFAGETYHTANWPAEGVDFTRKRVGIIGTGSSGIQAIPQIAEQAGHLYVFQRTPNFSFPAWNRPLDDESQRQRKANYPEYRQQLRDSGYGVPATVGERSALVDSPAERQREYEQRWAEGGVVAVLTTYCDLTTNEDANATAAEFVHSKIRQTVDDPAVAELLSPTDHPLGTKRPCVDIGYFETFNRDNVTLVDIRSAPIEEITPNGVRVGGREYELDAIVFATGFDAMTGALTRIDIRGRGGATLKERWADGPRTYLGLQVAGFPNLFTVTGPGSPSVLCNMVLAIEQHVEWIADAIGHLYEHGLDTIEPTVEAQDAWVAHVNEVAEPTPYAKANSWYMGANIPGKARVFMPYVGGFPRYRRICADVVDKGYEGFALGARHVLPEPLEHPPLVIDVS